MKTYPIVLTPDPDESDMPRVPYRHRTDFDWVVVERRLAGEALPLTQAERRECVRRLVKAGVSNSAIATRLDVRKRTVERDKAILGIAGRSAP